MLHCERTIGEEIVGLDDFFKTWFCTDGLQVWLEALPGAEGVRGVTGSDVRGDAACRCDLDENEERQEGAFGFTC